MSCRKFQNATCAVYIHSFLLELLGRPSFPRVSRTCCLREVAFLDKEETEKRLKQEGLWPKQLYKTVKDEYKSLKHNNKWPPAMSPTDRQALPRSIANVAEVPATGVVPTAGINLSKEALGLLLQHATGASNTSKKGKCHVHPCMYTMYIFLIGTYS